MNVGKKFFFIEECKLINVGKKIGKFFKLLVIIIIIIIDLVRFINEY